MIDRCFGLESVEAIADALGADTHPAAKPILETMSKMSPTSLKVTHRQITLGRELSLKQCFEMEYALASKFVDGGMSRDFYEGVRSVLIDKDNKPNWQPATLRDVKGENIDWFFKAGNQKLDLQGADYHHYPVKTGLVSESDVYRVYTNLRKSKSVVTADNMVDAIVSSYTLSPGILPPGTHQKIDAILQYRCKEVSGSLKWQ
jgi:hypothetical protein